MTTIKSVDTWRTQREEMLARKGGKCLYCDNKASRVIACNDNEQIKLDDLTMSNFKPICETDYTHFTNNIRIKAREKKTGQSIIWELEKDGNIKEIFRV